MKNKILFFITTLLLSSLFANAQHFEWVQQAGGIFIESGNGIVADASGNIYITGYFGDIATFGNKNLTSAGSSDVFIAKYNAEGQVVWAQRDGGSNIEYGEGIAIDASGNIYITGYFHNTTTFGSTTLTSAGGIDVFIAKYDANGNILWAKKAGDSEDDLGLAIAADASGNIYITGIFKGTTTFGGTTLKSSGKTDVFIAKIDTNGSFVWARKGGGSGNDFGNAIAVDASGNSYVTGYFQGAATFGSITLTSIGHQNAFIAKYNADGEVVWAIKDGYFGCGIKVDASGNVYLTGYFSDTFGSVALTSAGAADVFIAKYDANGNIIWAQSAGGSLTEVASAIAVDECGNSYVTGYFQGTATFGNTTLTSGAGSLFHELFIAKYDANGNSVWAQQALGHGVRTGHDVAVDASGNVYVTGSFNNISTFGSTTLTSVGNSNDAFIAKINGGSSSETVLNIVSPLIGVTNSYEAINSIVASNLINGGNVKYFAGDFITMEPGFEVKKGTVFEAKIQSPCQ